MQAKIETLKAKDAQSNEYLLYPRTLTDCITDSNGTGFVDVVRAIPVANAITADRATYDAAGNNIAETFTKLQDGTVNAGDSAKLGGQTATQWQTKIDNIQTTSKATLSQAGWYRVAEIPSTSGTTMVDIALGNRYSAGGREFCVLRYDTNNRFKILSSSIRDNITFTKIRLTGNETNSYIEVYYNFNASNPCEVSINTLIAIDSGTSKHVWKAIDFIPTAEEVDGVTVTTTYDIPANASPATSVDLANYLPKTGGDVSGYLRQIITTATAIEHNIRNSLRNVGILVTADGKFSIYDNTYGKNIILSTPDGINTFNGTATGNLPLTGGTISTTSWKGLGVKNTASPTSTVEFTGSTGVLGYLGCNNAENPVFIKSDGNTVTTLLHSGNYGAYALPKTGGTITGTGAISFTPNGDNGYGIVRKNSDASMDLGTMLVDCRADGSITDLKVAKNGLFITERDSAGELVPGCYGTVLHTGNSAKVAISATAPTDTTALWYDTVNKMCKRYVDGAWQA